VENPVLKLLHDRHSRRSIATDPLPEDIVAELMEAARLAPSCSNNQPWRYLFLLSAEAREKGRSALTASNALWASRAPLLIFGYTRRKDDCTNADGRAYHQFDLGLAAMNIMLAATHHNLVARPMAGFVAAKVKEIFSLDAEAEPLVAIAIGYPSDDVSHLPDYAKELHLRPRTRKDVSEIITRL
jgi:nitroreductase